MNNWNTLATTKSIAKTIKASKANGINTFVTRTAQEAKRKVFEIIPKNAEEGMKRIYDYVLPLESDRLKKAYGIESNVSKLLTITKEVASNRITLIFVKEKLGF